MHCPRNNKHRRDIFIGKLWFLLFIICIPAFPQGAHLDFEAYTVNQGLPHNFVRDIKQDNRGFIWIATQHGLARFDGFSFKTYQNNPQQDGSIPENDVFFIAGEGNRSLWLGVSNGLIRFDMSNESFSRIPLILEDGQEIRNRVINRILVDSNSIWMGTDNGLLVLNRKTQHCKMLLNYEGTFYSPRNFGILSIYRDNKGITWLGSVNSYLHAIDSNLNVIGSWRLKNKEPEMQDVQFNGVYDIQEINGNVWLLANDGLCVFDKNKAQFNYFGWPRGLAEIVTVFQQSHMVWDGKNYIYLATKNGLARFNTRIQQYEFFRNSTSDPTSISDNHITTLFLDKSGVLWVGTINGGINKAILATKPFHTVEIRGKSPYGEKYDVYSVFADSKGFIWTGTYDGMVDKYDPVNKNHQFLQIIPDDKVVGKQVTICKILEDRKNNLWFGTWSLWLLRYDPQSNKVYPFRKYEDKPVSLGGYSIRDMKIDQDNKLWISFIDYGMSLLDLNNPDNYISSTAKFIHYRKGNEPPFQIPTNYLVPILPLDKNLLIIGTDKEGIILFNTLTGETESFSTTSGDTTSLLGNTINTLCKPRIHFKDKVVWVGTSEGLNRFDLTQKTCKRYTPKEGLGNSVVYGILEDSVGRLWLTTSYGLSCFDPVTNQFNNFYKNDGLLSNICNQSAYFSDPKTGFIYIGHPGGITFFNPLEINPDTSNTKVVLTGISLFNVPVPINEWVNGEIVLHSDISLTREIVLSAHNNDLSISFSAMNYIAPGEHKFRYRLNGFEKDWKETDGLKPYATYTNLPHGKYLFQIKATNHDQVWSNLETTLLITIQPPFYKTWFFRIIAVLFVILVIYLMYRIRIRRFRKNQMFLRDRVNERTEELRKTNLLLEEKQKEINQSNQELFQKNAELENHRRNLESLVKERTIDLEKALLKAEESDRLKSSFLANMSHEIRTPMNAIMGFSDLLKSRNLAEDAREEYISIIQQSGENLLVLINDILDLSLIEAGQLKIFYSEIELVPFLENLIQAIQISKKKENVVLRLNHKNIPDNLILKTDKIRLQQILTNLLDNAFKFTDKGYVELGIENYSPQNTKLVFYIEDTGCGIPQERQEMIFEQFIKLEEPTSRLHSGTGLGLAIVKKLVTILGGEIKLESNPGIGSCFRIYLPNQTKITEHEEMNVSRAGKIKDLNGLTILVAEDEQANYLYLEAVLKKNKAIVLHAYNGKKALELIAQHPEVALVLMDIRMPVMDGIEATRILKKEFPALPVIAQTAFALKEDKERFGSVPFDDYITKPTQETELLRAIIKTLKL